MKTHILKNMPRNFKKNSYKTFKALFNHYATVTYLKIS
jgi:hypothetical protein